MILHPAKAYNNEVRRTRRTTALSALSKSAIYSLLAKTVDGHKVRVYQQSETQCQVVGPRYVITNIIHLL